MNTNEANTIDVIVTEICVKVYKTYFVWQRRIREMPRGVIFRNGDCNGGKIYTEHIYRKTFNKLRS